MIITIVPTEHKVQAWMVAKPFIEKALKLVADRFDILDIWEMVAKNDYQLWLIIDNDRVIGAFVTHIVDHPKARGINVPYMGADEHTVDGWFDDTLSAIEDYGRLNGCSLIEFIGREGWTRRFKKNGLHKSMCIFEKQL
jgi:hypothetical protein